MNVYIVEQFIKVLLIKKVSIMLHSIYSLFMCIHMHASRWKIKENALYLIFFGIFSPHSHFNFLWQWQQCWICRGKRNKKSLKMKTEIYKRNYVWCTLRQYANERHTWKPQGRGWFLFVYGTFKEITINLRGKWILNDILSWSNEVDDVFM